MNCPSATRQPSEVTWSAPRLKTDRAAREHLTCIGRMYQLPPDIIRKRCEELPAMMDFAEDETKLTLEFSHGPCR